MIDSNLAYPDFVGVTGQQNTPPGAHKTVHAWVDDARITRESFALDLACSTGFSGREVHADTSARIHGIDISEASIETARQLAKGNPALSYQIADAASLPLADETFTHVLGGCNFGFIHQRHEALNEVARVLRPGGLLCVSSFHYTAPPPSAVLERVGSAIGFTPDPRRDYRFWRDFFGTEFELVTERKSALPVQSDWRLRRAVAKAIRSSPTLRAGSHEDLGMAYERLLEIRRALNTHRQYQGLSVAIWRKR
ncbi:class I SAM-dependent methyltransferase [Arthrobacter sp. Y-9]|uniref:class I SAM-dependent methyltransferase n=1 Tax=Arthrobacter sp. Y-9 TaxID=3039385 RepID=UPI00241DE0DC|nr:class I SAM-dependent methyltransferase [Arthrobacter sp. Y-9]WFR83671.1 class I SAM-dependent methyltransferase [Arthrobacter sp. Y-9]